MRVVRWRRDCGGCDGGGGGGVCAVVVVVVVVCVCCGSGLDGAGAGAGGVRWGCILGVTFWVAFAFEITR